MRLLILCTLLTIVFAPVAPAAAQVTPHQELQETVLAEVVAVLETSERRITGTDTTAIVQELSVRLLSGDREGAVVELTNDLIVLEPGDVIYVNRLVGIDGGEYFAFKDVKRHGPMVWLTVVFVALLVWFARWQGVRALFSLALSIGAIFFILVPALLAGYSAPWVSLGVAGVVLALVLFITHGINPRSLIAFIGTMLAVGVTCVLASSWVSLMRLTGFGSDASIYLNFATSGELDFAGLLLGGIIIGILGVLDDVAITQASVVQELKAANSAFTFRELYTRALRVGRDHVGSLVNTLAFAYVGVSLPLVLLLAQSEASILLSLNQEVVAAELLRIVVGSIGLLLAVPFTTAAGAWYFKDRVVLDADVHQHHSH